MITTSEDHFLKLKNDIIQAKFSIMAYHIEREGDEYRSPDVLNVLLVKGPPQRQHVNQITANPQQTAGHHDGQAVEHFQHVKVAAEIADRAAGDELACPDGQHTLDDVRDGCNHTDRAFCQGWRWRSSTMNGEL